MTPPLTFPTSVLVIDDNTDLADNIGEILADSGVDVHIASSAAEALACFDDRVWSLVVTDVRMPGCDGLELLVQLKARSPSTPVLVMTAFADRETLIRAHQWGALAVLDKPLDLDTFLERVWRVATATKPVLVVDDDPALVGNLTDMLCDERGVLPHSATNLALARRLVAVVDFHVALIDLRLPDGDGMALARELQRRPDGSARPVIIMTGYPSRLESVADDSNRSPTDAELVVLTKPFFVPRLLERLREIL
jgi:DNA-binding NtrC family response regulator